MNKPFLVVLFIMTGILLGSVYFFTQWSPLFPRHIVMLGTVILAFITLITFTIAYRSSLKANPNQFVRGVMGATFLKFALCVAIAGIYIYIERKNINKADLYLLMLFYAIFTSAETIILARLAKKNPNDA